MSVPEIPAPPAATAGKLRPVAHPDLSPILTHFVTRGRPPSKDVPAHILAMPPKARLESILWQGSISAFVTFSGGNPAVCMTETKFDGLKFLIRDRGYEPWGLVFSRQGVYDAGGGPVWYTRPAEYAQLSPAQRSWAVRLDPGSDWLEEREWRVPRPPRLDNEPPKIPLISLGLEALIVADRTWNCTRLFPFGTKDGQPAGLYQPLNFHRIPRFWWNPTSQEFRLVRLSGSSRSGLPGGEEDR